MRCVCPWKGRRFRYFERREKRADRYEERRGSTTEVDPLILIRKKVCVIQNETAAGLTFVGLA